VSSLVGVALYALYRESDTVYRTYSSNSRGVEFLMGYYPILDPIPKCRDEGDEFQRGCAATTSTNASETIAPVG
jgi:predicted dithiol-disulfide oxidoreductase (DUF899 family)